MTEKIYISPIASKTVDIQLRLLAEAAGINMEQEIETDDAVEYVRDVRDRNVFEIENVEDTPYA